MILLDAWSDLNDIVSFKGSSRNFTSNIKRIDFNFYSPWSHQKTIGFLMISGGIEFHQFAQIRWILEVKFGDDP